MARTTAPQESHVDVLVIGAGPAGCMAATWLSKLGLSFRIIDKSAEPLTCGHADGTTPRTLECFESFDPDLLHKVHMNGNPMSELLRWGPKDGTLVVTQRDLTAWSKTSRLQGYTIHQGNIERALREQIQRYGGPEVERSTVPSSMFIDKSKVGSRDSYPIRLTLQHIKEDASKAALINGDSPKNSGFHRSHLAEDDTDELIQESQAHGEAEEVVHAKYVIGCDGAHSWTRQQLGFPMEGDRTDAIYGVMDVVPITDFPGTRTISVVATEFGTMLIIPRERGMVRYYVQLSEAKPDSQSGQVEREKITPETISAAIRRGLAPYKWSYNYCDWWSAYQIGQRMSSRYNDDDCRVFLAGDAVHTHSPKAGQGMNVSMMDTYNLGWKIAGVVKGVLTPEALRTYEIERIEVARQLIDYDRQLTKMFAGGVASSAELGEVYIKNIKFSSGIGVHYDTSVLVAESAVARQHLASDVPLGERFPSFPVVNHASAMVVPLQQVLRADGNWRLIVFGGDIIAPAQKARVDALGEWLDAPDGLLQRYRHSLQNILVHRSDRTAFFINDIHPAYYQYDEEKGYGYDRVFVDCEIDSDANCGRSYIGYGVSEERGCVVLTRPDQYVAWIGDLEDVEDLEAFVDGFMARRD